MSAKTSANPANAMMPSMTTQREFKPTLGILVCGHSPDKVVETYGRYNTLFEKLLGADQFSYQPYFVVDNDFPASVEDADAWLITGSKHGAYDDLPWINPLETFIRQIYAKAMPLAGICFGHQIMAQALGGRVVKHDGGWIAGTEQYQVDIGSGMQSHVLNAWHQDQVVELPADARVIGSSNTCAYAALSYRNNTVSLQPHPEFENDYVKLLLTERGEVLPSDLLHRVEHNLEQNLTNKLISQWLVTILSTPAS